MYNYQVEKQHIFTEEGQVMFLKIRNHVKGCLKVSGAITMGKAISAGIGGYSWQMTACVDRLVELGEIREIAQNGYVAGQNRIFVNKGE